MKRIDKNTGKTYNKKTRYSGVPYPYIVAKENETIKTNYDLYRTITANRHHFWYDFAQYHVFRNELIKGLPLEEQLQFYLLGVSLGTKSQILQELSLLKYNPFNDFIPIDSLSKDLKNYFNNRKKTIMKM